MGNNCYFEGSETYYADIESENIEDEIVLHAFWISGR